VEWALYRIVGKTVGLLSPGAASRLGSCLGMLAARVFPARRAIVERNLRIAFGGEKSPEELVRLADEVFRRSGANLVASLSTAGLDPRRLGEVVHIENPELAAEVIVPGKGAVVLLAHMGNWEALAHIFPRLIPAGHRSGTIYRLLNNPYMDEHVKAVRRSMGLELFEKRSSPLAMASFVRSGGALGILSDQRAEASGEIVPFFGRLTSCTPLPAIISRRLGTPVIGLSMRTVKPGHWTLKLHRLEGEPTTMACMKLLEEMIRESPADVFWLQDRWRIRSRPLRMNGRPPSEAGLAACTKLRRVLVWLDVEDSALPPPEPTIADIEWECSLPTHSQVPLPAWLPAGVRVHTRQADCILREGIMAELKRIDRTSTQPLEVVIVSTRHRVVAKACRRLGVAALKVEGTPE
jgi:Kdo2-lipid IVA lauroyltransferase/acyltransferase